MEEEGVEFKKQLKEVNELIDDVNKDSKINDPSTSKLFEKSQKKIISEKQLDNIIDNFEQNLDQKLQNKKNLKNDSVKETVPPHEKEKDSGENTQKNENETMKDISNANFRSKADDLLEEDTSEDEELDDIYTAEYEKSYLRNTFTKNDPVEQVENILQYSFNKKYENIDKLSGEEKESKIYEKQRVDKVLKRSIGEFRRSARKIFESDTVEDANGRTKNRPPPLSPKDLFDWKSPDFKQEYQKRYDEKLTEKTPTSWLADVTYPETPNDYFNFIKEKMENENFKMT